MRCSAEHLASPTRAPTVVATTSKFLYTYIRTKEKENLESVYKLKQVSASFCRT
ncbi:hypothetical protein F511_28922 [Dorcoceras hygrometricum]|uniref:Uncharacterized protein n=1 Tax=Dorcoceras hygrometricum TaxID=472368 RepID=A0A2Z7AG24_9LAMI|nr:hypothetical protein F511_28922 [Dorcoceras hygrometricum]